MNKNAICCPTNRNTPEVTTGIRRRTKEFLVAGEHYRFSGSYLNLIHLNFIHRD